MTDKNLDTMTTAELRAEFKRLRDVASYGATREEWMDAVKFLAPVNASPIDWVHAAAHAEVECDKCSGSGVYMWGATVNGVPTHTGTCYRCEGKGRQGQDDFHRNRVYDLHAIARAFREMVA